MAAPPISFYSCKLPIEMGNDALQRQKPGVMIVLQREVTGIPITIGEHHGSTLAP